MAWWVSFCVLPGVAGLVVLIVCAIPLVLETRALMRQVSASKGRLMAVAEALTAGLDEMRAAQSGGERGVDGVDGPDGAALAGRVAAWRDVADVRGR